jgi:anthranilate synthase/aminodeoxychorismate synthase-like glutamine amidotransferase
MPRVLVLDNYDSFTYNLVQYLGEMGAELEVVRNDREGVGELMARSPDRVVVSPGPCTPDDAGVSIEAIRRFAEAGTPVLGVCLGHQSLVQGFGGRIVRGDPIHGKDCEVSHDGRGIYAGIPSPLVAGRYHSLVADPHPSGEALAEKLPRALSELPRPTRSCPTTSSPAPSTSSPTAST